MPARVTSGTSAIPRSGGGTCGPRRQRIDELLGEGVWATLPQGLRAILADNGPAILAEVQGEWWLPADAAALAAVGQPVLLVAADDSRPELREPTEAPAAHLPNARIARVPGGHRIDPAEPDVLAFVEDVLFRG
jgi:hypothetical protein